MNFTTNFKCSYSKISICSLLQDLNIRVKLNKWDCYKQRFIFGFHIKIVFLILKFALKEEKDIRCATYSEV